MPGLRTAGGGTTTGIEITSDDAGMLSHYLCGRPSDPADDQERIDRLKDEGYLVCTQDAATGTELLKTTESGVYEGMMCTILGIDSLSDLRFGLERALGLR